MKSQDLMNLLQDEAKKNKRYLVEILLDEKILGAQPLKEDLIAGMVRQQLKAKAKKSKEACPPITDELIEELTKKQMQHLYGPDHGLTAEEQADFAIDEAERQRMNVFFRDEHGPYLGFYAMKACLNDCIVSLGISKSKRGSKQTMQHGTIVQECDENGTPYGGARWKHLHFYDDDWNIVSTVDRTLRGSLGIETCGHVVDANGPRSILKKSEFMEQRRMRFCIQIYRLDNGRKGADLTETEVARALNAAQTNAVGGTRKLGHGTFKVTRFERVQ